MGDSCEKCKVGLSVKLTITFDFEKQEIETKKVRKLEKIPTTETEKIQLNQ